MTPLFPPGNEFNGRELATLTWVAIGLGYAITKPGTVTALLKVAKAVGSKWVAGPMLGMAAWTLGAIWIGRAIGIWTPDLVKDSVEWFVLSALLLYVNLTRASTSPGYFKQAVVDNLRLSAFLVFYVNLFVLPYPVELVLVLVATLLAGVKIVAPYQPDGKPVQVFCDVLLTAIGLALVIFSTERVVSHWSSIDLAHQLRLLLLPVWLTASLVPYLFGWSLFGAYLSVFMLLRFNAPGRSLASAVTWAVMVVLNIRIRAVAAMRPPWLERIAASRTFGEALAQSRAYLGAWREMDDSTRPSPPQDNSGLTVAPAIPIPGIKKILERQRQKGETRTP